MPVQYSIDKERGIVLGRASGRLLPRELIDGFSEIARATQGAAVNMDHLFLAAPGTLLHEMDAAGMAAMRNELEALHRRYPGRIMRTAIVVSGSDPENAIARLWQAIADSHPAMATKVKIFWSEPDALTWLAEKPE